MIEQEILGPLARFLGQGTVFNRADVIEQFLGNPHRAPPSKKSPYLRSLRPGTNFGADLELV